MRGANTGINVTTETYTHVTRDPYAPTKSVNRDPTHAKPDQYDLEVTATSTDKDLEMDGDGGVSDLGYGNNSSVVRLTSEEQEEGKREVRFGHGQ